jgi:hypothetical protein
LRHIAAYCVVFLQSKESRSLRRRIVFFRGFHGSSMRNLSYAEASSVIDRGRSGGVQLKKRQPMKRLPFLSPTELAPTRKVRSFERASAMEVPMIHWNAGLVRLDRALGAAGFGAAAICGFQKVCPP